MKRIIIRRLSTTTTSPRSASAVHLAATTSTSTRRSVWQFYLQNLQQRPLLTKAIMACIIFFVSDSVTQYATAVSIRKNNSNNTEATKDTPTTTETDTDTWQWDAARALSGAGFGIVATSWLHYWWGFLEITVGRLVPSQRSRLGNALTKVAIDQLCGAPFYIYSYYVLTNFLQDLQQQTITTTSFLSTPETNHNPTTTTTTNLMVQSLRNNHSKASEMLWPTMIQHWKLWPVVHSINFYFVPLHHRVLVQNCVLIGWSAYLSHLNHGGGTTTTTSTSIRTTDHTDTNATMDNDITLMTPNEEIKVTIIRRETALRLQQQQATAQQKTAQNKKVVVVTAAATAGTNRTTVGMVPPQQQ
jgi:hypothetical protein